jgi:tetratricopeptide (TPR) repeat protein
VKPLDNPIYRCGQVEVDASLACLKRAGREEYLRPKSFQVLLYLLEHHDRLVTKEELLENVWKGTAVTDDSLVQLIVEIRKALGDDSRRPRLIKTIPKLGYRFIGEVEALYPHPSTVIETEEVTTFEVQYEQEITTESLVHRDAETIRPARRLVGSVRPRVVVPAVLLAILISVFLWSYIGTRRRAASPVADVTLRSVPGKKSVVVMYFDNQSANRDIDWLREGLADMFIADLSASKHLTVLSRQQLYALLERLGHNRLENVQLEQALDIAQKSQAESVVLGSFVRLGEKLRIEVQLYEVSTGRLLTTKSVATDRDEQILTQVDALSSMLAAQLADTPGQQEKSSNLADVMTDNLEAYHNYSLALEKAEGLDSSKAIALLERATALDPQFAMAYARIGYTYSVSWGLAEKGKPYLEKAFQLSHRLTEKDRLYIVAWYSIANLDYVSAIKSFQQLIELYPTEIEAYYRLGRLLGGQERYEEAIAVLQRALIADPEDKDTYNVLGGVYNAMSRHDDAIAMYKRYVALAPDLPNAHDSLGLAYQWAGDYEQAIAEYDRAVTINPDFEVAVVHLGNCYFQLGRYRDAISQYERYIRLAPSDVERARGYRYIATIYLRSGDIARAEQASRKETGLFADLAMSPLTIALERGDPATAERLKQKLPAVHPYTNRGAQYPLRYRSFFDGSIALESGRAQDAIAHFKEALLHGPLLWDIDSLEDCLANAYLALGQFDDCITEYQRVLSVNPNYPLAHYHLGQAYDKKGMSEQARAEYAQFLQIWKQADANIPEVIAARKRLG